MDEGLSMKRPAGITILSTALACLAAVGFVNGALEFFADRSVTSPVFAGVAFLYGVTALVSSVALWRMRHWAYRAFLFWIGAVVLTLLYFQFSLLQLAWFQVAWAGPLALVLLFLLERYVRGTIPKAVSSSAE